MTQSSISALQCVQPRWQRMLDCLAHQLRMPLAMVSAVDGHELVVAQTNQSATQIRPGQRFDLAVNTYCSRIVRCGEDLFISDVASSPSLEVDNPTAAMGLTYYYGEAIRSATGVVIGTVCVMDIAVREDLSSVRFFLTFVRQAIEEDLQMALTTDHLMSQHQTLLASLSVVAAALRRLPKSQRRAWQAVGLSRLELKHVAKLGRATRSN